MSTGRTTNAMGVTAIVFGGGALLLSWIPYIGIASIFLGGIGVLLALGGLLLALADRKSGLGSPITGGVLSGLAIAIAILVTGTFAEMRNRIEQAQDSFGPALPVALNQARVEPDPDEPLEKSLTSLNREVRVRAIEDAKSLRVVPTDLIAPLIECGKRQVVDAVVAGPVAEPMAFKAIPLDGDETTLTRINLDPREYIDKRFYLVGGVRLGNRYGRHYRQTEYYALDFYPVDRSGTLNTSISVGVFVDRGPGSALTGRLLRGDETGMPGILIRATCTVKDNMIGQDSEAIDSIEILDWQFLQDNGKRWSPKVLDTASLPFVLAAQAGPDAITPLLDVITAESEYRDKATDAMTRACAVSALSSMSRKSRETAFAKLNNRSKTLKGDLARSWATIAANRLRSR
jgi:hypothetical protein